MELTVYKASAGSGKTYTLTREYLVQALRYARNPHKFRSILAVTFTNKATEEMKDRIITTLNGLAAGNDIDLSNELCRRLTITAEDLQSRAQKVRSAILHDYTHFSVSTIDTFFQKLLHAFVREAGLRPGFNLELDTARLLEEAVEKLLQETGNDEILRKWLFTLIENRIEDRSSWDLRPMLKEMGREVFKEHFRRFGKDFQTKINNKKFMENYAAELNGIITVFEKDLLELGKTAIRYINGAGLEISDFKYGKSGFANYFSKLAAGIFEEPAKRVYDAIKSDENGWAGGKTNRHAEINSIYPALHAILCQAVKYYKDNYFSYNTACAIARNFMELGVLADIDKYIRQIVSDENIMPISDSVHLLSSLINNSETPFVYERTGNRYKTFMIDEFQDTSGIQWKNFRPLLYNSLAENEFSMVVGDVKQSIYRWRNGDWSILAYQLPGDFATFGVKEEHLDTNWRSKATIIEFNNALFRQFPQHMQLRFNTAMGENPQGVSLDDKAILETMLLTAYVDAEQKISPNTALDEGYVNIDIITDNEEQTSVEQVMERLPLLVAELQDRGYSSNDIAILVRQRNEGQLVADSLLAYKKTSGDTAHCFDVISQDSLFIAGSSSVQMIIAAMRMAVNPNDHINSAFLQHELQRRNYPCVPPHAAFSTQFTDDEWEFINYITGLSLNQAFEAIIRHYNLNEDKDELPFIQELHDLILAFSNRKLSDISSFMEWWDDKGNQSTLSPGENQSAINIMTIHKSKGLQFPVVIIPFANWDLDPKLNSTLWVSPKCEPFNSLPYVPVSYKNSLQNTDFTAEYLNEKLQSHIDNINLLYVAFTRAKNELYVSIPKAKVENRLTMAVVLPEFFKQYTGLKDGIELGKLKGISQNEGTHIEFGIKHRYLSKKQDGEGLLLINYPSTVFRRKLRLHYDSQDYFEMEPDTPIQRRNYGVFMHRIFAQIKSADEKDIAINSLFNEGLIDDEDKWILTEKVEKALRHPVAKQWFDGSWEVKAETGVLLPYTADSILTNRPDRVMIKGNETLVIDYKFGLIENNRYIRQLANYASLLKQMGYANVKSYIWYVDLEKVVEI